jgi:Prp8 binding protein
LWDVYGECKNYNVLTGHKSAVLEIKWNAENKIVSASADKSVALWDASSGSRIRKLTDHTAIVNSCSIASAAPSIFASGSDDCTAIVWDTRDKSPVATLYHDYQILSTALVSDGLSVFTGGIDNIIRFVACVHVSTWVSLHIVTENGT